MAREAELGRTRVLVVEDEATIRRGLCDVFTFHGYAVEGVEDGLEGLRLASEGAYDLVLLDVMLPSLDGFSLCERLRQVDPRTLVLMLTAKGAEEDVLRGFEVGADDYLSKPFSVRELLARAQVLLKRAGRPTQDAFRAGPYAVDPTRSVARTEGHEVDLSAREVCILRLLALEPGRIVSRRTLLREAWQMSNPDQVQTRTVDMHIAKLRKKLAPGAGHLVETVRGQGYRLCESTR